MDTVDRRVLLGWVEAALRTDNPDLPSLRLVAQSHYRPGPGLAFIEVYGVIEPDRRRRIRAEADRLLGLLGCEVCLEPGFDVFSMYPTRPATAHQNLRAIKIVREAMRKGAV